MFELISRAVTGPSSENSHSGPSQAGPVKNASPVALSPTDADMASFFRRLFSPKIAEPKEAVRKLVAVRRITDRRAIEGTWRDVALFMMPDTCKNHFERQRMEALTRAFSAFNAAHERLPDDAFYQAFHLIRSLSKRSHTELIHQIVRNAIATDANWANEIIIQYSCRASEPWVLNEDALSQICQALLEATLPMWEEPATRPAAALSLAFIANAGRGDEEHVRLFYFILDTLKSGTRTEIAEALVFMESAAKALDRHPRGRYQPRCVERMRAAWPDWQFGGPDTRNAFVQHRFEIERAEEHLHRQWEKTIRPRVIVPFEVPSRSYESGGCGPGC